MFFKKKRVLNYFTPGLKIWSNQIPLRFDSYSGCSNFCTYCGIKGSLIDTINGQKPIEELKINDIVLSVNIDTIKQNESKMTKTMNRFANNIYIIETEQGNKINGITGEHPIFTQRGWVNANKLTENDYILVGDK